MVSGLKCTNTMGIIIKAWIRAKRETKSLRLLNRSKISGSQSCVRLTSNCGREDKIPIWKILAFIKSASGRIKCSKIEVEIPESVPSKKDVLSVLRTLIFC
jgi:hypothetical protein